MAEEVRIAAEVADRREARPADRVPGLAAAKGPAAGIGHDHPDPSPGLRLDRRPELLGRPHRVGREQYHTFSRHVALVDAGTDTDVPMGQDREDEGILEQEFLGLVEHHLDEPRILTGSPGDRDRAR